MKQILIILTCVIFYSCFNRKQEHLVVEPTTVYDSIVTIIPKFIKVKDSIFIWQDGLAIEGKPFLHVVNLLNKKEITNWGKIGRGPDEFISPIISRSLSSSLLIHDMNNDYQTLINIDSLICINHSSFETTFPYHEFATERILISNSELISLCPAEEPFLFYDNPDTTIQFGISPFGSGILNSHHVHQGSIDYNPLNEILAFSLYGFPYIALYKKSDSGFNLVQDIKSEFHYTNSNGVIVEDPQKTGIYDLALTKDYIVTIQRDYETSNFNEHRVGGNTGLTPTTLFINNYNGDLVRILNLEMPLLRLDGNYEDNTIYLIATNPDYLLVSINLDFP